MKRKYVTTILFIFIAIVLYINSYLQEKDCQYQELIGIGETDSSMTVFFSTQQDDDMEIYHTIVNALEQINGSLYCFTVEESEKKETYSKYVYVNNTELFENLSMRTGRFFKSEEMESDCFISSVPSEADCQIGVINVFDKNMDFQIRTLYDYAEHHNRAFQKTFTLELENLSDFETFQSILSADGIVVSEGNHKATGSFRIFPFVTAVLLAMVVVLMLILFYDLIKSYKQIGIEKMLGYDAFAIWSSRILPILFSEAVVFAITTVVLSAVFFNGFNILIYKFIGKMILYYVGVVIFTLFLISIPFLYVKKIPVYAAVKNQRPLKALLRFNLFVKGIIITLLLIVLSAAYTQITWISAQKSDKYDNWDKMRQYAYIYEECYTEGFFDSFSPENIEKWKAIYQEFNRAGGIMADFSSYSPLNDEERNLAEFPCYCDVTVNPNYLKMFPVFDTNGNIIEVSEQEEDYIILVPEQYKNDKQMLISYYEEICENEDVPGKNIRIVWMQNDQKLFSCALDIGIEDCNTIKNPVVIVLTEKNGFIDDYARVAAYTGDPFKIKVEYMDDLQSEINSVLSKYFDLNKIWFPATGVYDAIGEQIAMANDMLALYSMLIFVLVIITAAIIAQGIVTYVRQYQRVLAIKKLLGYRLLDKYSGYFAGVIFCYLISVLLAFIIKNDTRMFIFAVVLFVIEFICSILYICVKDRKNIIQVTKGAS